MKLLKILTLRKKSEREKKVSSFHFFFSADLCHLTQPVDFFLLNFFFSKVIPYFQKLAPSYGKFLARKKSSVFDRKNPFNAFHFISRKFTESLLSDFFFCWNFGASLNSNLKVKVRKNLVEFLSFSRLKCDFTKKATILVEAKLAILGIFNNRGKIIWRITVIRTLQFHLKLSKQSFTCPALKVVPKGKAQKRWSIQGISRKRSYVIFSLQFDMTNRGDHHRQRSRAYWTVLDSVRCVCFSFKTKTKYFEITQLFITNYV